MINIQHVQVRSIEDLIAALQPVGVEQSGVSIEEFDAEMRRMRNNISAVLSFTSPLVIDAHRDDEEFQHVIEEVRRQCLIINGMISRLLLRRTFTMSGATGSRQDLLNRYNEMAGAACRMCLLMRPDLGNCLSSSL